MSYQVLARKWRPRSFDEMVGQEHVLKALVNGLDNGRLHHAYLFTGTRGVGKTTLARIIAKCLNCELGVSSTPCGECGACKSIAEGRFVDLLEVDAASRTKVEDTRDLLDNVQYLPTSGRYKVYLIDEVHMLSTHSFNALLKTLEEPPPHVKFLLATTDPQKLPVTVLSRCLQFNLKNLGPERIVSHLRFVLGEEKVPFEEEALWALGRAADGSMRDALSLTDQAIAHGGGLVTQAEVGAMLGTIDRAGVVEICEAVAAGDAGVALAAVQKLADHAPDYSEALGEMLSFWHRIAIAQTAPDALDHSHGDHQRVLHLAAELDRETVQLLYQITLLGRRDLPHAADPRSGFEMVLLRLLAFHPVMPDTLADQPMPSRSPSASSGEPAAAKKSEMNPQPATPADDTAPRADTRPVANAPVLADKSGGGIRSASLVAGGETEEHASRQTAAQKTAVQKPAVDEAPRQQDSSRPAPPADVSESAGDSRSPARPVVPHLSLVKAAPPLAVDSASDEERPPWEEYESVAESAPLADKVDLNTDGEVPSATITPSRGSAATDAIPRVHAAAPQQTADETPSAAATALASDHRDLPPLPVEAPPSPVNLRSLRPDNWLDVYLGLDIGGLLQSIAANLYLDSVAGAQLAFTLDSANSSLYREEHQPRLAELLTRYFGEDVQVVVGVGEPSGETPWQALQRRRAERLRLAVESLRHDPLVRTLIASTAGELLEHSVRPLD